MDGSKPLGRISRWRIGDGRSVSILDDVWLADIPLSRWSSEINVECVIDKRVADFIEDGCWRTDRLELALGPVLAARAAAIQLHEGPDLLELRQVAAGKSVASLAYNSVFLEDNVSCKLLKKLKLCPRVKMFWWRFLHDGIPTSSWLASRGIGQAADCTWGCGLVEDRFHVAFGCRKVLEVAAVLGNWGVRVTGFNSLNEFLDFIRRSPEHLLSGARFFAYSVHQCWRARNDKLHGQPLATPTVMATHILDSLAIAFNCPLSDHWDTNQPSRLLHTTLWCSLPRSG